MFDSVKACILGFEVIAQYTQVLFYLANFVSCSHGAVHFLSKNIFR